MIYESQRDSAKPVPRASTTVPAAPACAKAYLLAVHNNTAWLAVPLTGPTTRRTVETTPLAPLQFRYFGTGRASVLAPAGVLCSALGNAMWRSARRRGTPIRKRLEM